MYKCINRADSVYDYWEIKVPPPSMSITLVKKSMNIALL